MIDSIAKKKLSNSFNVWKGSLRTREILNSTDESMNSSLKKKSRKLKIEEIKEIVASASEI